VYGTKIVPGTRGWQKFQAEKAVQTLERGRLNVNLAALGAGLGAAALFGGLKLRDKTRRKKQVGKDYGLPPKFKECKINRP